VTSDVLRSRLFGFADGLATHAAIRNSLTDDIPDG
jgi:hypothetical protein